MRNTLVVVMALLFVSFSGLSQEAQESKNNIKIVQLGTNVYMLQGRGGNIGLSMGEDGIFMVDDQFADITDDILGEIKKINKKPVQFLVNTHHHGDHTGGNINMANEGTIIFAHENVRERLLAYIGKSSAEGKKVDDKILPTITFAEDISFHYNNEEIKIFHVDNAHTDGDALVYFTKSNVLHTGDAYFENRYPYIDLGSGGSVEGYIEGLQKAYSMINDDTKIIPGHGGIAANKDLYYSISMLNRIWKQVSVHHYEGKSLQEVQAMNEITQIYDDKGFGDFYISREKMIEIVYKDISRQKTEEK